MYLLILFLINFLKRYHAFMMLYKACFHHALYNSWDFCFLYLPIIFFKDFIYLFMRDTEREAETQAKGEAGSMQGA